VEVLYLELRSLAGRYLSGERLDHTLQPTAVLHEAFVRLSASGQHTFNDRRHFFSSAAAVMRHVLVDHARRKRAEKHGGQRVKLGLSDLSAGSEPVDQPKQEPPIDVIALDGALVKLAAISAVTADLVQLRFFAGMSLSEACAALGLTPAQGQREWRFARAWLLKELPIDDNPVPDRLGDRSRETA
jgi:RNA polymerase sigma factor (TIGR02999 family)